MVTDAEFAEWAALADPALPPAEAARVATHGHLGELFELAHNPNLTVDVLLAMVGRGADVAGLVVNGGDIPGEVVSAVLTTYPDDASLVGVAQGHLCAPIAVKLALPLSETTPASAHLFCDVVRATDDERAVMQAAMIVGKNATLGQVWARARPAQ